MKKSTTITIILLISFSSFLNAQTDILEFSDKLSRVKISLLPPTINPSPHNLTFPATNREIALAQIIDNYKAKTFKAERKKRLTQAMDSLWFLIKTIRTAQLRENTVQGKATINYSSNASDVRKLYQIGGNISLTRGSYPQEWNFSSSLQTEYNNGQLTENISNLHVAYDRFLEISSPFLLEGYGFLNRSSNLFMGVKERYQLGAGVIVAHWSKKLVKQGKKDKKIIDENKSKFATHASGMTCTNGNCPKILIEGLTKNDTSNLNKSIEKLDKVLRKRYSKVRLGCLFGLFQEFETINYSDSLYFLNSGTQDTVLAKRSIDQGTTNNFMMSIRPTLDLWVTEDLFFSLRPHLKFSIDDFLIPVGEIEKFNARLEIPISVSLSLSDNYSLSLSYAYYKDFSPTSVLQEGAIVFNNKDTYLTAPDSHHMSTIGITYNFK